MKLGLHWGGVLTVMGCRLLTFVVCSSESEVEQIGRGRPDLSSKQREVNRPE